jgi:hypothetical protein
VAPWKRAWHRGNGGGTVEMGVAPWKWGWHRGNGVAPWKWGWHRGKGCGTASKGVSPLKGACHRPSHRLPKEGAAESSKQRRFGRPPLAPVRHNPWFTSSDGQHGFVVSEHQLINSQLRFQVALHCGPKSVEQVTGIPNTTSRQQRVSASRMQKGVSAPRMQKGVSA